MQGADNITWDPLVLGQFERRICVRPASSRKASREFFTAENAENAE